MKRERIKKEKKEGQIKKRKRKEPTLSDFATERNFLEIRPVSAFWNAHCAQTLLKTKKLIILTLRQQALNGGY